MIKQFLRDVDWGEIDYLVVDTPPGTSDEHLSIVQYLSACSVDGAVIVTTPQVRERARIAATPSGGEEAGAVPTVGLGQECGEESPRRAAPSLLLCSLNQEVALQDVRKEISFCHKVKLPVLGVVENMSGFVCPKCKVTFQGPV